MKANFTVALQKCSNYFEQKKLYSSTLATLCNQVFRSFNLTVVHLKSYS